MGIQIARGRQFAVGDVEATLFNSAGEAGSYLQKAADALVAQQVTIVLRTKAGTSLSLSTADQWAAFLAERCATKAQTAAFETDFGVSFEELVNALDDVAASDAKGITIDLSPDSELSLALGLDTVEENYGRVGPVALDVPAVDGTTVRIEGPVAPSIGPDILDTPAVDNWSRDRTEMESWADFERGNGAGNAFRSVAGPGPFEKLHEPRFDDAAAMALVARFALPLHLEFRRNSDGTIRFQGGAEMFRDVYYDDHQGSLEQAGASVRGRVRFDDDEPFAVNRVLVQAKEGRAVAGADSQVRKFEKRWEGGSVSEANSQKMLVSGRDVNGAVLPMAQKLYQLVRDRGTLPADGQLRLEPKYMVLQKRTRTHLWLDSVAEVQKRRDALQVEIDGLVAASTPVPAEATAFLSKLDQQLVFLTEATALLRKYGKRLASGECFIISGDRYQVYDTAARSGPPNSLDDEAGLIAKGPYHFEAEWDSASSDPFGEAIEEVAKRLGAADVTPEAKAELDADATRLEEMRGVFRADVAQTVSVIRDLMIAQGINEDTARLSKDQRAAEFAKSSTRPMFWF